MTLAAQLGVAPVLLATFGPIPVASLPANLLCVPVAGLVMVWGLTAGLVAGVVGAPLASLLHQPTRLALAWLELVAERTARAPLGELHLAQVVALAGGLAVVVAVRRPAWRTGGAAARGRRRAQRGGGRRTRPCRCVRPLAPGVVRWHGGGADVIVLGGGGRSEPRRRRRCSSRCAGRAWAPSTCSWSPTRRSRRRSWSSSARAHRVGADAHGSTDGAATVELGRAGRCGIVAVPGRLVVDAVPRGP